MVDSQPGSSGGSDTSGPSSVNSRSSSSREPSPMVTQPPAADGGGGRGQRLGPGIDTALNAIGKTEYKCFNLSSYVHENHIKLTSGHCIVKISMFLLYAKVEHMV